MKELIHVLNSGGVAVMKTDTIYGIVGQANSSEIVNRIYDIKNRDQSKACIILVSDIESLRDFGIDLDHYRDNLNTYWPGPVSIILPIPEVHREGLEYLHCGNNSLAFRLPDDEGLREILQQTGPLIAPSANPEGKDPAMNIEQAREYFADLVDHYEDTGKCEGTHSSKLLKISKIGTVETLRSGSAEILQGQPVI